MTKETLAAKALQRAHESVREAPDTPEARARTVAAMQEAMSAAPAQRARVWPALLALAAGLCAVVGAGLWLRPGPAAQVVSTEGVFAEGHRFPPGARVDSGAAPLRLQLSGGVTLGLAAQSAVLLGSAPVEVRIERGEVAAEITPRAEPFTLDCGDTRVFTRGARLRLSPGAGCDGRTSVEVLDGEATLADGQVLKASETWPRCAAAVRLIPPPVVDPAPPARSADKPAEARPTEPKLVAKRPKEAPVAPSAPPEPAEHKEEALARQNALYLQAVSLHRGGSTPAALEKLDALLREPQSPLAETALAQKMRWLSPAHRTEARGVAAEYLRRFPMGFARAEAEQLVLEPR